MKHENIDEELGRRLQAERQKLGLSQIYLAELLNHDQTYISKLEKGRRQITVIDFLAWCKALNLSADDMMKIIKIGPYADE